MQTFIIRAILNMVFNNTLSDSLIAPGTLYIAHAKVNIIADMANTLQGGGGGGGRVTPAVYRAVTFGTQL